MQIVLRQPASNQTEQCRCLHEWFCMSLTAPAGNQPVSYAGLRPGGLQFLFSQERTFYVEPVLIFSI